MRPLHPHLSASESSYSVHPTSCSQQQVFALMCVVSVTLSLTPRDEMKRRAADRAKDDVRYRQMLRKNYAESQARHAYRLANPAYADGRIW